jgi:hypothetical protein
VLFCEREIARDDERRIEMGLSIARFRFVRDLSSFDFAARPSLRQPKAIWHSTTPPDPPLGFVLRRVSSGPARGALSPFRPSSRCEWHFAAER